MKDRVETEFVWSYKGLKRSISSVVLVRFFCLFVFFSTSDSVSSLPCRVCAASSALTLYGDRCFTERSFSIPGFRPNSRVRGGSEDWRATRSSQQVLLSDIDIVVAELDGRKVN